ncbi:MAG: CDP-alcohol phosphatidyltransferase family protein [Myxococcota bacterium]
MAESVALQGAPVATEAAQNADMPTCVIVGDSTTRVFGLNGVERLRRALRRAKVANVRLASDNLDELSGSVVLLRADHAFEELLFVDLLATRGIALMAGDTPAAVHVDAKDAPEVAKALLANAPLPVELRAVTPKELSGDYNKKLRKQAVPYLIPATPENAAAIEKTIFNGSYKGVTDFISKYVWPWPARQVTRLAANLGLTPNMITTVGLLLTLATFWFFWHGQFALGLACAWLMTFLDTVDGKLARVTMTSSKFGDIFDHGIDLISPPFWWWAWLHATALSGSDATIVLGVLVIGYIAQRLQEGYFIGVFKIEMHVWRRFDSVFRQYTARRNPNLVILTVALLVGEPTAGIVLVAGWTAFCFAVHMTQIVQASFAKANGKPIRSWMSR